MKKMSKILSGVLSGLFLLSFAGVVLAQTQKPDQAPPKLDKLEDGAADPSLSVGKPEPKNKVTEKRNNAGKVTEVQVKSGKSNYTLKADPEVGNAPKGTVQEMQTGRRSGLFSNSAEKRKQRNRAAACIATSSSAGRTSQCYR
jgi:hypothetical protein